jgi:uncharacterized membrane protein YgdD (TMEM256/DUF423 family)
MEAIKSFINTLTSPTIFFTLSIVAFCLMFAYKRWVEPMWAGLILLAGSLFFILSMFDPDFRLIVAKPDNVPIAAMLFLVGFFTWVALRQAFQNDERMRQGLGPMEKEETDQKVLVWPDLVYSEFICLIVLSVVMLAWAILLQAPTEEPANLTRSPNPSKAPWYFLGLQEMLVYFDPWLAGVVFPSLIIVGLMAIPYLDVNPRGNGYYTFRERKWEILVFMFGFIVLWILLVIQGTFLRGPNWNFFGPFERWDLHKLEALTNVNLSEFIYVKWLPAIGYGGGLPKFWLWREMWGILLVLAYFLLPPPILARTKFRGFFEKMGFIRFNLMVFLLLFMIALPIKMYLRWAFNLKYLVAINEFFFNI